jgi:hypothetical protein
MYCLYVMLETCGATFLLLVHVLYVALSENCGATVLLILLPLFDVRDLWGDSPADFTAFI